MNLMKEESTHAASQCTILLANSFTSIHSFDFIANDERIEIPWNLSLCFQRPRILVNFGTGQTK